MTTALRPITLVAISDDITAPSLPVVRRSSGLYSAPAWINDQPMDLVTDDRLFSIVDADTSEFEPFRPIDQRSYETDHMSDAEFDELWAGILSETETYEEAVWKGIIG